MSKDLVFQEVRPGAGFGFADLVTRTVRGTTADRLLAEAGCRPSYHEGWWVGGWVGGWMGGWVDGRVGRRWVPPLGLATGGLVLQCLPPTNDCFCDSPPATKMPFSLTKVSRLLGTR